MFKKMLILITLVLFNVNGLVFAQSIDHWWHGGVSADVNDPANWTDRDAATDPTTPSAITGTSNYDIVRIGGSWDSEDLNGNGVLDPGEDLNGNGVIDDPDPSSGIGYGGYYGEGGGIDLAVDPVLSETYVSRRGDEFGGWWFVLNAPNILTLEDGAYLVMNRDNCNLRNGGRLEVQGRSDTDGPSLIVAKQFRIAENGSIKEAALDTSQLRINGTGWVQMDPKIDGTGAAFMIGTSAADPDTMPRGEIIIEDNGRLELAADGVVEPFLYFGNTDIAANQIIIRDEGELWLPGATATMGKVGTDGTLENATVTSLQDLIDMELIINDQGGEIEVSGSNPTVVKATGIPSGLEDNLSVTPLTYTLMQNYPNPFNLKTNIQFQIPNDEHVTISVYNSLGQQVAILVDRYLKGGMHHVTFDAAEFSSDIYFYKIQAGYFMKMNKMLLLK